MTSKEKTLIKQIDSLTHENEVLKAEIQNLQNTVNMYTKQRDVALEKAKELIVECEKQRANLLIAISSYKKAEKEYKDLIANIKEKFGDYKNDTIRGYKKLIKTQNKLK